jgi:hypothetical protein
MLTHDLVGYQGHFTTQWGGKQVGRRGFLQDAKYYSSMRQQLAVFGQYPLSGPSSLAKAYAQHHLHPVLSDHLGLNQRGGRPSNQPLALFDRNLSQVYARLNEVKTRTIPYRFEVSIPIQFTNGAAQYLRHRALNDSDFWIMPSEDLVTRYTSLYNQASRALHDLFDGEPRIENAVKVTVLEDLIRRGIPSGFLWKGASGMRQVLRDMPHFNLSIIHSNLPSWKALQFSEPPLTNEEVRFKRLIQHLHYTLSLPSSISIDRLFRTLWIDFTASDDLSAQLERVVNLYLQDLAHVVRTSTNSRSGNLHL